MHFTCSFLSVAVSLHDQRFLIMARSAWIHSCVNVNWPWTVLDLNSCIKCRTEPLGSWFGLWSLGSGGPVKTSSCHHLGDWERGARLCQFPTLACQRRSTDSHRSSESAPTAAVFSPREVPDTLVTAAEDRSLCGRGRGTWSSKLVGLS